MIDEETKRVLESIGLHKNEVEIYLDLIMAGESGVLDISKRTKTHRTNVYDTVEKLIKKGLVREVIKENRRAFSPISPKDLLNYVKQKEYQLQKIIPKIEEVHNKPKPKSRVMMLQGIQAIRATINSLLDIEQPVCTYGIPKEAVETLGGFILDYHKKRVAKKIPQKHIYNLDARKRIKELNSQEYTEARFLPSLYNTKVNTTICGDKVILFQWEDPFITIIIENSSIAQAYKKYFDILWEEAIEVNHSNGDEQTNEGASTKKSTEMLSY